MNKLILVLIFTLTLYAAALAQSNQTDWNTFTITTYYPAPYGVYRNMRLQPSDLPSAGVGPGVMYYNQTENMMKFYNGSTWINMTGGGGDVAGGLPLVNSAHTQSECTNHSPEIGNLNDSDVGFKQCRFNLAACPSGWTQYKNWSAADAPPGGCGSAAPWGNHTQPCCQNCNGWSCYGYYGNEWVCPAGCSQASCCSGTFGTIQNHPCDPACGHPGRHWGVTCSSYAASVCGAITQIGCY